MNAADGDDGDDDIHMIYMRANDGCNIKRERYKTKNLHRKFINLTAKKKIDKICDLLLLFTSVSFFLVKDKP